MGLNTTSGLSIGGGLSLGRGLSRGGGLVETGSTPASVVAAYVASVTANGGTVSAADQGYATTFFTAEFASGAYALTDDYWVLWMGDAPSALMSWKQLRLATVTAAPTFTTHRGYAFNGTTQYIDTGFIPDTHKVAMSFGNQRLAVYERTNVSSSNTSFSCSVTTPAAQNAFRLTARNAGNMTTLLTSSSINIALGTADSRGLISASRSGNSATVNAYQRGVALTPGTTVPSSNERLPTGSMFLAANNNGTGGNIFRAASIGFACIGAPLSAAQELAQYNAVQAWATSVGANV